jgi:hypothetical protein
MFTGAYYILHMSCVSGDEVQVAIHLKEDIRGWLDKLDHEGSSWSVYHHVTNKDNMIVDTRDLTQEFLAE